MKILVADDDAVSLMIMKRMLVQSGYEVITANCGVTAMETLLQENGPRLLLLDWMMPQLSGPEVCQALRALNHRAYVYIILLTARDSKDDLIAGLGAGADDYLTKPCHLEELRARLRTGHRVLELEDGLIVAREEMRYRATHDPLTSLLNRGAIVDGLSSRLQSAKLENNGLSLVLCDIDHFKRINDTYGHSVGDEVLREVSRRLQDFVQPCGVAGRYGGEEFLLLARESSVDHPSLHGNAICERIRASPIQTSAGPLQVTLSAGSLHLKVDRFTSTPDQLLQKADLLLYQAKHEGRDCAVSELFVEPVAPAIELCPFDCVGSVLCL